MPRRSGRQSDVSLVGKTEDHRQRLLGITPGAKLSRDPEAAPSTEVCNLPGCNVRHATHSVRGGD